MFFHLSKIVWALIQPLNFILLLTVFAALLLWRKRVRPAKWLVSLAALYFLLVALTPLPQLLMHGLEKRFPQLTQWPAQVDGVILLGGAQRPVLTRAHGQPQVNDAAETMLMFLALARRYPNAKAVFTGGSGDPLHQDLTEADTVRMFLSQQDFDPGRVIYETNARNTYENAILSKRMVQPQPGETWLLVAGAAHMPRAMGVFRQAQWQVVPVPVNYEATAPSSFRPGLNVEVPMRTLTLALHEWIGLTVYYLTGKTDAWFPAP